MKNNFLALSIIVLAVSVVIGGWLISEGLSNEGTQPKTHNQLLTQEELSDYLGISVEKIQMLGFESEGEGVNVYNIPVIIIRDEYLYPKSAIDAWLKNVELLKVE